MRNLKRKQLGSIIFPNPPNATGAADLFFDGRQFLYNANVAGYNGNSFAVQIGNWSGLSTVAGTIITPTYSTANAVTAIPREARRAPAGAAADSPGWNVGVTPANPNSILFPGTTNDSGFKMTMIGGIDQDASLLVGTEFLFGIGDGTGAFPTGATPLSTAARQWLGLYSESISNNIFIGYKNANQAIVNLAGPLTAVTWTTFQGWMIVIEVNPKTLITSVLFRKLAGLGSWVDLVSVQTLGFNPGRVPLGPAWRVRKNNVADVQTSWISNVLVQSYFLGAFSVT